MTPAIPKPEVSEITIQKSLARFATIRVGAARQYPFLGQGIYAMIPRPVPGLRNECGGWAMDKYGRCYFDPEMILGLGEEQYSVQTLIADFIHEVWHWIRRHPERFEMFSACRHGEMCKALEHCSRRRNQWVRCFPPRASPGLVRVPRKDE